MLLVLLSAFEVFVLALSFTLRITWPADELDALPLALAPLPTGLTLLLVAGGPFICGCGGGCWSAFGGVVLISDADDGGGGVADGVMFC